MSKTPSLQDPHHLAEQYKSDVNLRARIETHQKYTVGPGLESNLDAALDVSGTPDLLDVGCGPDDYLGRLRRAHHRGRLVGIDNSPGMIAQAASSHPGVEFLLADAQSLPFPDATFSVVTARHMLYHVPNIPLALSEIRRVLRPAGRFLAVTNASNYMHEYRDAIREALDAAGPAITPPMRDLIAGTSATAFNEANGADLIRATFGNVQVRVINAALVFDAVEPVLRYFDSARTMRGIAPEPWALAGNQLRKVVARKLAAGPWRVSKPHVLLLAQR